jgi:hypothetical protein
MPEAAHRTRYRGRHWLKKRKMGSSAEKESPGYAEAFLYAFPRLLRANLTAYQSG